MQKDIVLCRECTKYKTIYCTCDGCCISDDWYCADGERASAPKFGVWIDTLFGYKCSNCTKMQDYSIEFQYCPHCGARMVKGTTT